MNDTDLLAERFEDNRPHLRSVAYRMLGSMTEADDAVQEAWLRLNRADSGEVVNLGGWLTTVVARVSLDMLRSRKARREDPLELRFPDPVLSRLDDTGPEHQAELADSLGIALLVVLETLTPAERLAFVLHDMFAMPFEEIAPIVDRTPAAARQLASRARRRVRGEVPSPDADLAGQRRVVEAFLAAARDGDFEALVAVLDPDVVLRADYGTAEAAGRIIRGAEAVAQGAMTFRRMAPYGRLALVNGGIGIVTAPEGEPPFSLLGFTVAHDRIVAIDILADLDRLATLDLSPLDP